jgi:hypothetical protein
MIEEKVSACLFVWQFKYIIIWQPLTSKLGIRAKTTIPIHYDEEKYSLKANDIMLRDAFIVYQSIVNVIVTKLIIGFTVQVTFSDEVTFLRLQQ